MRDENAWYDVTQPGPVVGRVASGLPMSLAMAKRTQSSGWSATLLNLAAVCLAVGIVAYVGWRRGWFDYEGTGGAAQLVRDLRELHDPGLAGLIFLGVWTLAGAIGFPALPLMIAGGVIFGTFLGTFLNLVGTALGASVGYAMARAVVRGRVQCWLERHLPVGEMSRARGFFAVARFRLLPIVPVAVGNFAAGLARIDFWAYLGGTVAGQFPSTVIYTYFADAMVRAATTGARSVAARDVLLASGLLLLLSIVPRVVRR